MPRPRTAEKPIIEKELAKRFEQACELNDRIPPYNFGRLSFLRNTLKNQFSITVSSETIRKWLAGEARPRPDRMKALARIMKVDEAWLALGIKPDLNLEEKRQRLSAVDGAVSLVAGVLNLNGASCAFPEDKDRQKRYVHFFAILNGRHMKFHVALAQDNRGGYRFHVPNEFEELAVIGVVRRSPVRFDLYRLTPSAISKFATRRGGYMDLNAQETSEGSLAARTESLPRIENFREFE